MPRKKKQEFSPMEELILMSAYAREHHLSYGELQTMCANGFVIPGQEKFIENRVKAKTKRQKQHEEKVKRELEGATSCGLSICPVCNSAFAWSRAKLYCSKKCEEVATGNIRESRKKASHCFGVCPVCGKEFERANWGKTYCSSECKKIGLATRLCASTPNPKADREPLRKECRVCGSSFTTFIKSKVYCSPDCQEEGRHMKERERYAKYKYRQNCGGNNPTVIGNDLVDNTHSNSNQDSRPEQATM